MCANVKTFADSTCNMIVSATQIESVMEIKINVVGTLTLSIKTNEYYNTNGML